MISSSSFQCFENPYESDNPSIVSFFPFLTFAFRSFRSGVSLRIQFQYALYLVIVLSDMGTYTGFECGSAVAS
ncbi:hypothetical protein L596_002098 [Steinernema carpocapsae]|uniref:Uncharacterized protein n=1 Tax=Steinernema carpocapsae TaxID=34508 RepID=A0A4U8UQ87_STECR|nr:hypothetical protein L596_002098 [Steinernema carpocapsae]